MAGDLCSTLITSLGERSPRVGLYFHDVGPEEQFQSYPMLASRVLSAAEGFRMQGISQSSRVVFPFATSIDAIAAFLALIVLGALPLSIKIPSAQSSREVYADYIGELARRFGASSIVHVPGLDRISLPIRSLVVSHDVAQVEAPWVRRDANDIAFVQFSSGTTSAPKGVPIHHGQLLQQLKLIVAEDARTIDDVGASWLPLYHDMGLVGALLTSLWIGHDLHVETPTGFFMNPLDWLRSISERAVTGTVLPNFGLAYLVRYLREGFKKDENLLADCCFNQLRRIYIGSDAIDHAVVEEFSRILQPLGLRQNAMCPSYGMAEAVLMVSCTPYGESARFSSRANRSKVASVGPVLEDFEIRVLYDDGTSCEDREVGEVFLRGGTLSSEYFEDNRPLINTDGWYRTGDLGYIEHGYLHITGRVGERVKIHGQSYFLPAFEQALQTHPDLRPGGVAVIQEHGELLVLCEARRLGPSAFLERLRRELAELLLIQTGIGVPLTRIRFVARAQLLRTSSGKLQRAAITSAYLNGTLLLLDHQQQLGGETLDPRLLRDLAVAAFQKKQENDQNQIRREALESAPLTNADVSIR